MQSKKTTQVEIFFSNKNKQKDTVMIYIRGVPYPTL